MAAGVLVERGRVLVARRKQGAHLAGLWELPGGKCEEGEDPKDALARELREETGVEVRVGPPVCVTFHRYAPTEGHAAKAVLLLFYEVTRAQGSPEPAPIDVAELMWADAKELGALEFPPADVEVIALLRARLSREAQAG